MNTECPECKSKELYRSQEVAAGGAYGPNLLPHLGGYFSPAKFIVVVCESCGLTRFFASQEARRKLSESSKWRRLAAAEVAVVRGDGLIK
ncbi:MAG: hypothetical protein ACPGWR_27850 [Ardenticatenaceae bacterium]